ncbi:sulfurtransferase TusA [Psychrobacter sp. FDAARGOS_221]|uniref:sulfurtransferase TusA n=1 Tax=Psychrobacter sp. FDAARGOS_221 TaxID=1975705 RepID=UPI000BB53164|nr:sulfurtransferase TusA [Psychrobacter sp. FDAARGOS_221]PNK60598.1 sulfurtransferase TusA [Psychrobacter sp. FDAARGOS_221]
MTQANNAADQHIEHHLDTQGLICPEPVMLLHRAIRKADGGEYIEILATDPATTRDIPNFCRHLGHTLVEKSEQDNPNGRSDNHTDTLYRYVVQKKQG